VLRTDDRIDELRQRLDGIGDRIRRLREAMS